MGDWWLVVVMVVGWEVEKKGKEKNKKRKGLQLWGWQLQPLRERKKKY